MDVKQEDTKIIAENICKSVEALKLPNKIRDKEQDVTVSVGVYNQKPSRADNATDFVKKADKALYVAKENGKNQVKFFSI